MWRLFFVRDDDHEGPTHFQLGGDREPDADNFADQVPLPFIEATMPFSFSSAVISVGIVAPPQV
jgi:hypothetical protein